MCRTAPFTSTGRKSFDHIFFLPSSTNNSSLICREMSHRIESPIFILRDAGSLLCAKLAQKNNKIHNIHRKNQKGSQAYRSLFFTHPPYFHPQDTQLSSPWHGEHQDQSHHPPQLSFTEGRKDGDRMGCSSKGGTVLLSHGCFRGRIFQDTWHLCCPSPPLNTYWSLDFSGKDLDPKVEGSGEESSTNTWVNTGGGKIKVGDKIRWWRCELTPDQLSCLLLVHIYFVH